MYDVQTILSWKGSTVYTVKSTASVECAARALADHDIGALVVTGAEGGKVGIVSERDILRALRAEGAAVLARPVAEIMTCQITTCTPQDELVYVMERMIEGRLRHLPVIEDGQLVGMISIRDVVRSRLEEKEREVTALRERVEKVENLLRQIQISRL
ncbi:MAG: CBS domain-containing protein [Rhodoplanes sp.]